MVSPGSGEPNGAFPTTHWSVVLAAGHARSSAAEAALAEFCRAYWYPLYAYARRSVRTPADAQDLTQGFFGHLLQSQILARAEAGKGRFRSYLLGCFQNYIASDHARSTAQKRGGECPAFSLDAQEAEARFGRELVDRHSPETLYEKSWALAVIDQAFGLLEAEVRRSGRAPLFEALCPFLQGDSAATSYVAVARNLGTSEGTIKVTVHRLRRRYRDLLRAVVARTVDSPTEVEEELRHLMQVLQP